MSDDLLAAGPASGTFPAAPPPASVAARAAVAERLRAEGGLIAEALVAPGGVEADPDHPLDAGMDPVVGLAACATREAELLHHAPERAALVRTDDRDLALLAGDRLYALGLEELARSGRARDLAVLSDLVAVLALVHGPAALAAGVPDPAAVGGSGDPAAAARRGGSAWRRARAALGGDEDAAAALAAAARSTSRAPAAPAGGAARQDGVDVARTALPSGPDARPGA